MMNFEHQEDLGYGLMLATDKMVGMTSGVTAGKVYAKLDDTGTFVDDTRVIRGDVHYSKGWMIDVQSPTHNIVAGDWTCHQGDEELFLKIKQACANAGFVDNTSESLDYSFPLIVVASGGSREYTCETDAIDVDFKTYRTPEYFITAANAQPKAKQPFEVVMERFNVTEEVANQIIDGGYVV